MASIPLFTVEDYLKTTYRPDREYIDGVVVERNLGEYDHAKLQGAVLFWFMQHRQEWRIRALPEQRIQVSPTRFRVPDVTVLRAEQPIEQIFTRPPLLLVEVLSREDTLPGYRARVSDYLNFGIEHVWILDPRNRIAWIAAKAAKLIPADELRIPGSEIHIPLPDIFDPE